MAHDVKRRAPYYWSDFSDAWNYRVVPSTGEILLPPLKRRIYVKIELTGGSSLHVFRKVRGETAHFSFFIPTITNYSITSRR